MELLLALGKIFDLIHEGRAFLIRTHASGRRRQVAVVVFIAVEEALHLQPGETFGQEFAQCGLQHVFFTQTRQHLTNIGRVEAVGREEQELLGFEGMLTVVKQVGNALQNG